MSEKPDLNLNELFESIVSKIDDPIILAWTIIGAAFVWRLPDLVRAIGENIRLGRISKADVQRKKALLKEEVATKIARRRSHERRDA